MTEDADLAPNAVNGGDKAPEVASDVVAEQNGVALAEPAPQPEAPAPLDVPAVDASRRLSTASRLSQTSTSHSANVAVMKSAFEALLAMKEIMKKHQDIVAKISTCMEILKKGEMPPERIIFEPLRMVCEDKSVSVPAKILALDCLGKTFTFKIFTEPIYIQSSKDDESNAGDNGEVLLIEAAVMAVVHCFDGEATDTQLELQIIKVLASAIVNESMPVHGKVLVPAIRQMYNIFLLSLNATNQAIAQATLIQIIGHVFEKVRLIPKDIKIAVSNQEESEVEVETEVEDPNSVSLSQLEEDREVQFTNDEIYQSDSHSIYVKDVVMVIRILTNLAMKPLDNDTEINYRSKDVRSKLLSLHLIHWCLLNYGDIFSQRPDLTFNVSGSTEISIIDGVKNSLCLTIIRNGTVSIPAIFEITLEIFYLIITKMRFEFKYEIPLFFKETYLPIGEMKSSSFFQKRYILDVIRRLCTDPSVILEMYLNYDCDESSFNLFEELVTYVTNLSLTRCEITKSNDTNFAAFVKSNKLSIMDMVNVPELDVGRLGCFIMHPDQNVNFGQDFALKITGVEVIIDLVESLNKCLGDDNYLDKPKELDLEVKKDRLSSIVSDAASSVASLEEEKVPVPKFENQKQRKTVLLDAIKMFNFNPKKGVAMLDKYGFLVKDDPKSVAEFLLKTTTLNKTQIGEYLGGSKEEQVSVMHEFIDMMNFKGMNFVQALRELLQHFRLPGEAQVIDRFMLKFAEKYLNDNPKTFAEADTAYVLSYSIIMLNTDQHSQQVKKRMTLDEFIRNNKGIDNGQDIDLNLLTFIYEDIKQNEIVMKDEQDAQAILQHNSESTDNRINFPFGNSKTMNKELYNRASNALSSKTEASFTNVSSNKTHKKLFYQVVIGSNDSFELVKSLFDTIWMSMLASVSGAFNEFHDGEITKRLIKCMVVCAHMGCVLNNNDDAAVSPRAFINSLVRFTNVDNPELVEMKNIWALMAVLDLAVVDGSKLGGSWKIILSMISQFERLKLLSKGIDSKSVPDLMNARFKHLDNKVSESTSSNKWFGQATKSNSEQAFEHYKNQKLKPDMIPVVNSGEIDVKIDKVFSHSNEITGEGIYEFVKCLVELTHDEIAASIGMDEPRFFALQKLVDVCYYNMSRIRVEWSKLWVILNEEFNQLGMCSNEKVVFFAIDSLRQLSERFFKMEELAHFKFQREFLKPFDFIMIHNEDMRVREMVLQCLEYLLQRNEKLIKSGWETILEILGNINTKSGNGDEKFIQHGFSIVERIINEKLDTIINEKCLESLVVCLSEYAMNDQYQKINLKALITINKLVDKIGKQVDLAKQGEEEDEYLYKQWLPLLKCYDLIISNGKDLEVRSEALKCLFDALAKHGNFDEKFWDVVSKELLFPIFNKLHDIEDDDEDYWVWLSTTLLQALRRMVMLFTNFFDDLKGQFDGYLKLLLTCMLHSKDPISQSGKLAFKDIVLNNVGKFAPEHWFKLQEVIKDLFSMSAPVELFDLKMLDQAEKLRGIHREDEDEEEDEDEDAEEPEHEPVLFQPLRMSSTIVSKCRHQYSVIELVYELCQEEQFSSTIPVDNMLDISRTVLGSYELAHKFNEDSKLRTRVWNAGLVENLPNLRKQETQSVLLYVKIIYQLYQSPKVDADKRSELANTLTSLVLRVFECLPALIASEDIKRGWFPVYSQLLQVISQLQSEHFVIICPKLYPFAVQLVRVALPADMREAVGQFLTQVGTQYVS